MASATLGLCFPFVAPFVLWQASVELRAIRDGRAPQSGQTNAEIARGLALCEIVLLCVLVIAVLARLRQ